MTAYSSTTKKALDMYRVTTQFHTVNGTVWPVGAIRYWTVEEYDNFKMTTAFIVDEAFVLEQFMEKVDFV